MRRGFKQRTPARKHHFIEQTKPWKTRIRALSIKQVAREYRRAYVEGAFQVLRAWWRVCVISRLCVHVCWYVNVCVYMCCMCVYVCTCMICECMCVHAWYVNVCVYMHCMWMYVCTCIICEFKVVCTDQRERGGWAVCLKALYLYANHIYIYIHAKMYVCVYGDSAWVCAD